MPFQSEESRKAFFAQKGWLSKIKDSLPSFSESITQRMGILIQDVKNINPDFVYPSKQEINKSLEVLPEGLLQKLGIQRIEIGDNLPEIDKGDNKKEKLLGEYKAVKSNLGELANSIKINPIPRNIYYNEVSNGNDFRSTVLHEVGERLWDTQISNTPLKNAWEKIHINNQNFPTILASKDAKEDFAESVSKYYGSGLEDKDRSRYIEFIEKAILDGDLY